MFTKKRFVFIPIIILIAFVPLIVYLKEVPMHISSLAYKAWPTGAPDENGIVKNIDFFSYYKSWWIIWSATAAWFLFLWKHDIKNGKYNMFHIPILTYVVFIILSTYFSPFREVAIKGVADRYENIFVLIGYLLITTIVMNIVNEEGDVKLLIRVLFISAVIAGTIGIFQYFGLDFFQTYIGQSLMLSSEYKDLVGHLAFRFGICNIYSTMYNTNYVGSYMVMLLMISLAMYINAGKNIKSIENTGKTEEFLNKYGKKIGYGAFALLMFSSLVGKSSRVGIIVGVVSFAIMLLMILLTIYINAVKNINNIENSNKLLKFLNKYGRRIGYGAFTLLMFSNLIGSRSRAGMIGGVAAFLILLIIMRKEVLKNIQYVALIIVLAFGVFHAMNSFGHGVLFRKVSTITKDAKSMSGKKAVNVKISDIYANGNELTIEKELKADSIKLKYDLKDGSITAYDFKGVKIPLEPKGDIYLIQKSGYEKYRLKLYDENVFDIITDTGVLRVVATDEGIKYYTRKGVYEKLHSIKEIDRVERFDGKEGVGTGRVFIWSRTIPLLKSRMLYGSGPDTFSLAFPQNDYVGKLKTFKNPEIIVDKPHNMYLQIAVNTGVMSLVAFLVLIGVYLITGVKAYFNSNYETYIEKIGVGIFLAIIGYCVAGLFNDSLVSVAPVFWGLLGIGIAVNMINLKYDVNNKVNLEKK